MKKYVHISVMVLLMVSCKKNNDNLAPVVANLPNVTIGTQVWSIYNLDVSNYRNGDPIPQVADPTQWAALTTGAWCYYNYDPANNATYGKLYNWYAVNDSRGLTPNGWHIPSDVEWTTLTTYVGGTIAGGKMKALSSLWQPPNAGATNSSGFLGLPGGYRLYNGSFDVVGYYGFWWSVTETSTTFAWYRSLDYYDASASRNSTNKTSGFSVRCVRD